MIFGISIRWLFLALLGSEILGILRNPYLVGGLNPFEENCRQIGSFPATFGLKKQYLFETATCDLNSLGMVIPPLFPEIPYIEYI